MTALKLTKIITEISSTRFTPGLSFTKKKKKDNGILGTNEKPSVETEMCHDFINMIGGRRDDA